MAPAQLVAFFFCCLPHTWFFARRCCCCCCKTVLPSTRSVGHKGKVPSTAEASFVAPNASVIGDVKVSGEGLDGEKAPARRMRHC